MSQVWNGITGIDHFTTKRKLWSNMWLGWNDDKQRSYIDYFIFVHILHMLKGSCVNLQGLGMERHLSMDVLLQNFLRGRVDREK